MSDWPPGTRQELYNGCIVISVINTATYIKIIPCLLDVCAISAGRTVKHALYKMCVCDARSSYCAALSRVGISVIQDSSHASNHVLRQLEQRENERECDTVIQLYIF